MMKQTLIEIGFTENEASVYLTLLSLRIASTLEVAKSCGISRTTVYDVLQSLYKKGIVSEQMIEGKKKFEAMPPATLIDFFEKEEKKIVFRKQKVSTIVGELEKLALPLVPYQRVELFSGDDGIRRMLAGIFDRDAQDRKKIVSKKPTYFLCDEAFFRSYGDTLKELSQEKSLKPWKIVVCKPKNEQAEPVNIRTKDFDVLMVGNDEIQDGGVVVSGERIGYWNQTGNVTSYSVCDSQIAQIHRSMIGTMWDANALAV